VRRSTGDMGYRYRQEVLSMPWKETCAMDQKIQMIGDYLSGLLRNMGYRRQSGPITELPLPRWDQVV